MLRASGVWNGLVDRSVQLQTWAYDFGAPGLGNQAYYDGDFADYDGDGRMDRALIAAYGLLWNRGSGLLVPVASQAPGQIPGARSSWTGFLHGDQNQVGNDAVQWADVDGDGDLDNVQGGNGEPFVIQRNVRDRFEILSRSHLASATDICSTDIERDGDVDFVVAHAWCSDNPCGGPVDCRLLVGDGQGGFQDETYARGLGFLTWNTAYVIDLASADVDGDGDYDLAIVHGGDRCLKLARNDGNGYFSIEVIPFARPLAQFNYFGTGFDQGLNFGDIDGDGDLDMVLAMPTDLGLHPHVGHVVFRNDGRGYFADESQSRFFTPGYTGSPRVGGNGKLVDLDYDGDLDFVALRHAATIALDVFLNDGFGFFTFEPSVSHSWPRQAPSLTGADCDITDIDGDGTYDVWLGLAGERVRTLINTYVDPGGVPADVPRDLRVVTADLDRGVILSFSPPPFASTARYYKVYRSTSPGMATFDRKLLHVIGDPHQDERHSAPVTRHTSWRHLNDPFVHVDPRRSQILFRDETAQPGIRYYYTVSHVGTENTESSQAAEVNAQIPARPWPDAQPPHLEILTPTAEDWGQHPRILVHYADGGRGIDLSSLEVFFDVPLGDGNPASGGRPAYANIANLAGRVDEGTYIYPLLSMRALPPYSRPTLTVRIRDRAGNLAERRVTFDVTQVSPVTPVARFTASTLSGPAPLTVTFDGSPSSVPWGEILRWRWYFKPQGDTALGEQVRYTFERPGTYQVIMLVYDNWGRVAETEQIITVR